MTDKPASRFQTAKPAMKGSDCMGKVDDNKKQKKDTLLQSAFNLFTGKGFAKTTVSDIVKEAGLAKGTFYLYFKVKYEIRNRLISHESSKLFKDAVAALEKKSSTVMFGLDPDIQVYKTSI